MQIPASPLSDDVIRESAREVFAAPPYNRFSFWERFWGAVWDLFARALSWLVAYLERLVPHTGVGRTLLVVLLIVLVVLALWIGLLWWRRREARLLIERTSGGDEAASSLRSAEELAERGLFTEAAHALYVSLLTAAAQRGQLRLHHSKTIGDYVRELRRHAPSLFGRFREFARTYEYVIYGVGTCDRDRYERLRALARPIVHGAMAGGAHE